MVISCTFFGTCGVEIVRSVGNKMGEIVLVEAVFSNYLFSV
jgi:hypothetical protein